MSVKAWDPKQLMGKEDLTGIDSVVLIGYDQLNLDTWPDEISDTKKPLLFIELSAWFHKIPYHKQKIAFHMSAFRHFAMECSQKRHNVYYILTKESMGSELKNLLDSNSHLKVSFMIPNEWELRRAFHEIKVFWPDRVWEINNGFFIADPEDWKNKIGPGYRMEFFYREMRRTTGYLMDTDNPLGGNWNYDEKNRKPLPAGIRVPTVTYLSPDSITETVIEQVQKEYPDHFGYIDEFNWAVTRRDALKLLDQFIEERLSKFGPFEDAMAAGQPFLFHSVLSPYLNTGLLLAREVCKKALAAYHQGKISLPSVEGFIRQIIGWREFVHIYYEALMPDIRETNYFGYKENLPQLFWDGQTDMHCLSDTVETVLKYGYSHHITRLMVPSNFSNLTMTDPRQLNEWFWFAYLDAWEWVVLPNVLGMSTFADGGILASKPYISSGNYIRKMSNYCSGCRYNVHKKTGEDACPFNYLYWNFIDRERDTISENGRMPFMVSMFDKKSEEEKVAIRNDSERFLNNLKRYSKNI